MIRAWGFWWTSRDAPHGYLSAASMRYWLLRLTRESLERA